MKVEDVTDAQIVKWIVLNLHVISLSVPLGRGSTQDSFLLNVVRREEGNIIDSIKARIVESSKFFEKY